jgi:hypothetical protein
MSAATLVQLAVTTPIASGSPATDPVIVAVGDAACQSLSQGDGQGACRSGDVADLIASLDPGPFPGAR